MTNNMLYLATCDSIIGYAKVGMSANPEFRCVQLTTAVPDCFNLIAKFNIPKNVTDKDFFKFINKLYPGAVHRRNINGKFKASEYIDLTVVNLENLIISMNAFAALFNKKVENCTSTKNRYVERRRNFSFFRLGIKIGDKLVFHSKNCEMNGTEVFVLNNNQIIYNSMPYSTSALAQDFLGVPYPVNGNKYFYYNGKSISDLREEIEFSNDI